MGDPIVGHKTLINDCGELFHEPLRQSEAETLMAQADARRAHRADIMPTEQHAREMFFDAWLRLKELGWKDAIYCPKDGSSFDVIEAGSTGVHRCHYEGTWPDGKWWVEDHGDLFPSRPTLYRQAQAAPAQEGQQ